MNQLTLKNSSSKKNKMTKTDFYNLQYDVRLAGNIIRTRLQLGMTQEELAQKMGKLQPAIARAENGDTPPSHNLLKQLAHAFGARLTPPDFVLEATTIRAVVPTETARITASSAVANTYNRFAFSRLTYTTDVEHKTVTA